MASPTIISNIPKELQNKPIYEWNDEDVRNWIINLSKEMNLMIMAQVLFNENVNGKALLLLTEKDLLAIKQENPHLRLGAIKIVWSEMNKLQQLLYEKSNRNSAISTCRCAEQYTNTFIPSEEILNNNYNEQQHKITTTNDQNGKGHHLIGGVKNLSDINNASEESGGGITATGRQSPNIPPEIFKTAISLGYSFLVTWITSFVMVIVHERVPDMKRYPPLPDIFLDNVPHIPWAFHMCEITGALLFTIWSVVCIFHKYRLVLLRRFFALAGTVFLLRCVTMLITSLSVPGLHLQCDQADYAVDDTSVSLTEALELRITRAYTIWAGLGMSIQGVRTCGDYMFSGHTVALTLMNFFITEYTPRNLYFLHTLTWLLNMFGIFFILAAHEHYSIDVFVAFYITSRLFLYYHTLANNQALLSRDSNRTRIWFPMFSYFESSVNGIIPNEYDTITALLQNLLHYVLAVKDFFMLTAQRYWILPQNLQNISGATANIRHATTSTNTSNCNTPISPNMPDNPIIEKNLSNIKQE